jgi:hypothetical protein
MSIPFEHRKDDQKQGDLMSFGKNGENIAELVWGQNKYITFIVERSSQNFFGKFCYLQKACPIEIAQAAKIHQSGHPKISGLLPLWGEICSNEKSIFSANSLKLPVTSACVNTGLLLQLERRK